MFDKYLRVGIPKDNGKMAKTEVKKVNPTVVEREPEGEQTSGGHVARNLTLAAALAAATLMPAGCMKAETPKTPAVNPPAATASATTEGTGKGGRPIRFKAEERKTAHTKSTQPSSPSSSPTTVEIDPLQKRRKAEVKKATAMDLKARTGVPIHYDLREDGSIKVSALGYPTGIVDAEGRVHAQYKEGEDWYPITSSTNLMTIGEAILISDKIYGPEAKHATSVIKAPREVRHIIAPNPSKPLPPGEQSIWQKAAEKYKTSIIPGDDTTVELHQADGTLVAKKTGIPTARYVISSGEIHVQDAEGRWVSNWKQDPQLMEEATPTVAQLQNAVGEVEVQKKVEKIKEKEERRHGPPERPVRPRGHDIRLVQGKYQPGYRL